jgi:hypothetical protein
VDSFDRHVRAVGTIRRADGVETGGLPVPVGRVFGVLLVPYGPGTVAAGRDDAAVRRNA